MGRYISWDDVTGRYQDAAKKAQANNMGSYWLERAEYEVDGFLAARYTVPFTPAHPVVQDLCMDLTYYKMILNSGEQADAIWKYIEYRLKAIRDGTLVLTTSGTELASGAVSWNEGGTQATAFGPDDPVNWFPSSNWQEAVETDRELG